MTTETPRALAQITRQQIAAAGWHQGTTLEDRVAHWLLRWGFSADEVAQQHRALTYRLDFAWPVVKVALEVDGPRHLYDPQTARRDAERDARLRAAGWLVFRVDDDSEDEMAMAEQLLRVVEVVRALEPVRRSPAGRRGRRSLAADERAQDAARKIAIDNDF